MYRPFIEQSLRVASQIALEKFGNVSAAVKPEDNNQVLTEADIAIGKLLFDRVTHAYPKHNIIDEETGGTYTDFMGQPIDYSNPLAKAHNNFTCCAANPEIHRQSQAIIHA